MECIFCKIVARVVPAKVVHEDQSLLVFHDVSPIAKTHLLIIPKKHCKNMKDVDCLEGFPGQMFATVKLLAAKLSDSQSFKLICNNESAAGQVVFHLHWHFVSNDQLTD